MEWWTNISKVHILIKLFNKHGGYWFIDSSEMDNGEIQWSPYIGNNKGGMCETIRTKRVYDIADYYDSAVLIINQYLEKKEPKWKELIGEENDY